MVFQVDSCSVLLGCFCTQPSHAPPRAVLFGTFLLSSSNTLDPMKSPQESCALSPVTITSWSLLHAHFLDPVLPHLVFPPHFGRAQSISFSHCHDQILHKNRPKGEGLIWAHSLSWCSPSWLPGAVVGLGAAVCVAPAVRKQRAYRE